MTINNNSFLQTWNNLCLHTCPVTSPLPIISTISYGHPSLIFNCNSTHKSISVIFRFIIPVWIIILRTIALIRIPPTIVCIWNFFLIFVNLSLIWWLCTRSGTIPNCYYFASSLRTNSNFRNFNIRIFLSSILTYRR